jgi:hypothetical protein
VPSLYSEKLLKYDKKWVEAHAQCYDGMAWGLMYTSERDRDLSEALSDFDRADFMLWFLVKTGTLSIESAFDLMDEICTSRMDFIPTDLIDGNRDALRGLRARFACEAETAMTLGDFKKGHAISALTFLARMRIHILDGDPEEALKDGQCVLNNLVAAHSGALNFYKPDAKREQFIICDWLRTRVIVSKGA